MSENTTEKKQQILGKALVAHKHVLKIAISDLESAATVLSMFVRKSVTSISESKHDDVTADDYMLINKAEQIRATILGVSQNVLDLHNDIGRDMTPRVRYFNFDSDGSVNEVPEEDFNGDKNIEEIPNTF